MEELGNILLSYWAIAVYEAIAGGILMVLIVRMTQKRRRKKQKMSHDIEQKKKQQLDNALKNTWSFLYNSNIGNSKKEG